MLDRPGLSDDGYSRPLFSHWDVRRVSWMADLTGRAGQGRADAGSDGSIVCVTDTLDREGRKWENYVVLGILCLVWSGEKLV